MPDPSSSVPSNSSVYDSLGRVAVVLIAGFCLTTYASPPIALGLGILLALTIGNPFQKQTGKATKLLLQVSVVGLGFGMNLGQVVAAGLNGIGFTIVSISGTLLLGYLIAKQLKVSEKTGQLISVGTAICGGSAIAAVGPVIEADQKDMSVALATVFVLNAIALFIFPPLGHYFGLTQTQFGTWIAIAIHDTSSVVGAASKYGLEALQVAVPIKLTRTLWIIPLTLAASLMTKKGKAKVTIPYFILWFLLASVARSYISIVADYSNTLVLIARAGLTLTLFFIGAGLSKDTIRKVGAMPFILGISLWVVISIASFLVVKTIV